MAATATGAAPLAHTSGVILAGGTSARMGASKASLLIGDEPLVRRVVGRLQVAFADVFVVGAPDLQELVPSVAVMQDRRPGQGPLAGLETALEAMSTPRAFVVACDMPFVSPALAHHMAELAARTPDMDAVALRTAHGPEPLHTVYAASCLPLVRAQLDRDERSLQRLLERLHVREVSDGDVRLFDAAGLSAFNANTPDEWRRALALADSDG